MQTTEGQYEETLREDNKNNFPLQEKLGHTRYSISKPPMMMHNIPKYHTTKQIQSGQALKFDISRPDTGRQLWNRRQESRGNYTQEFIIETTEEIQGKETRTYMDTANVERGIKKEAMHRNNTQARGENAKRKKPSASKGEQ